MPYDPSSPNVLQEILRQLAVEKKLSIQRIIDLVLRDRQDRQKAADRKPLTPFTLTPASLRRFRSGNPTNKDGLDEVWRVLEVDPRYKYAFLRNQTAAGPPLDEGVLASALINFFKDPHGPNIVHRVRNVRSRLAGRYTMYRPESHGGYRTGKFMTSLVEVTDADASLCVFEEQNHAKRGKQTHHKQTDQGFLFIVDEHTFFMTRAATGGPCVKLAVLSGIWPIAQEEPAEYFKGVIYVTSRIGIYPPAKFFCKRLEDGEPVVYDSFALEDIPFEVAIKYLSDEVSQKEALRDR
jgi:hypothetical protein